MKRLPITRLGLFIGTVPFWAAPFWAGCVSLVPQRQSPPEGKLPDQFSSSEMEAGVGEVNRWWADFSNDQLNALVDEALSENLTLRQQWARLEQADALAKQSASEFYPDLTFGADAGYRRTVTTIEESAPGSFKQQLGTAIAKGFIQGATNNVQNALGGDADAANGTSSRSGSSTTTGGSTTSRLRQEAQSYGLSLSTHYEIDLWGRIRSGYEAAELDREATRHDLEATQITLAAEVVDRWLRILEQQELRRVLSEQLETNQTFLELVRLRLQKGQVSALDFYQQQQVVKAVERQIPLVEAQEHVLRHGLAVLMGKPPLSPLDVGTYDLTDVPPLLSTGIPADLLANRPDVRAALSRLLSADHRVAVARADRLPAIRLNGGIGYSAADIAYLFNDWFFNLAGGLTAPLFDGFRREAEVERTLAVVEERLAAYRFVVLTALQEVEDALIQEKKQREYIQALDEELEAASHAFDEALLRYRKSLNDYLPVLAALERTQVLTRSLVIARRELLVFRVDLYRALGGTWTQELQRPPRLTEEGALVEAAK